MSWYNPKDAEMPLIPDGIYEATVTSAEHKASKAGNPMVELGLTLYTPERESKLRDYLVSGSGTWKIKAFAEAFNARAEFDSQQFDPANYVNKNLRVEVATRPSKDPQYGPQNTVKDYLPTEMAAPKPATRAAAPSPRPKAGMINTGHAPMTEEDIPFSGARRT